MRCRTSHEVCAFACGVRRDCVCYLPPSLVRSRFVVPLFRSFYSKFFFFLAGLRYRVALREGPGLFLLWRVLFILLSLAAKMRVVSMHALITAALVGYFVSFWRLFLNQQ